MYFAPFWLLARIYCKIFFEHVPVPDSQESAEDEPGVVAESAEGDADIHGGAVGIFLGARAEGGRCRSSSLEL